MCARASGGGGGWTVDFRISREEVYFSLVQQLGELTAAEALCFFSRRDEGYDDGTEGEGSRLGPLRHE